MSSPARNLVALSTTSVFPERTQDAFQVAADLGFDGVEIMVSPLDRAAADPTQLERLRDRHQVPVLAIHAPTLLVSQGTWGTDPWAKLDRAAAAAVRLGADVVVVHPPFRWQREYARTFVAGIRRLNQETGVRFCVENMYPWRTPGGEFKAYLPGWDPLEAGYDHLCLDLSHASIAQQSSVELVDLWGPRLRHLHLTDGDGGFSDDHLLPGTGDQQAALVLQHLAASGYTGHTVLEVNTRRAGARGTREELLSSALEFTRRHLGQTS